MLRPTLRNLQRRGLGQLSTAVFPWLEFHDADHLPRGGNSEDGLGARTTHPEPHGCCAVTDLPKPPVKLCEAGRAC